MPLFLWKTGCSAVVLLFFMANFTAIGYWAGKDRGIEQLQQFRALYDQNESKDIDERDVWRIVDYVLEKHEKRYHPSALDVSVRESKCEHRTPKIILPSSEQSMHVWNAGEYNAERHSARFDALTKTNSVLEMRHIASEDARFFLHNSEKIIAWITSQDGEQFVTSVFHSVLSNAFPTPSAVVLDIGANAGFYGMLACSYGFRTVFFDPQPQCISRIIQAVRMNGFKDLAQVTAHGVSSVEGSFIPVSNETACEGRFPINEIEQYALGKHSDTVDLPNVHVSQVLDPTVDWTIKLAKIDTEGNELYVLRDLLPFFAERKIEHVVSELTPQFWRELDIARQDVVDVVGQILDYGYTAESIDIVMQSKEQFIDYLEKLQKQRDVHFWRV